jgi:hypothetical protein
MNYIEFSQSIKSKYPQYKDVDDLELANKMIAKYPEYSEQVTFDEKITTAPEEIVQPVTQEPTLMEKIRGISPLEVIKETPKQVATDIARLAPIAAALTPLGLPAQAGITAVSRAGKGLLEGEEASEALRKGAISGTVEAGIGKALKLTKPALKQIAKFATRAEKGVIDEAVKKPILTKIEPKTNLDTSEQIKNFITILNRKKSRVYEKALTKVSEAAKGKVADTKNVNKIIKEDELDRQGIKRLLLAGRSKVKKFDPNAVDKFIAGKELTFDEAKNVNSVLSDVLRCTTIEPVDKLKIGKLKDSLYESMEIYPGFKELNKKYSKQATLVQNIEKNLGKDISESKVNTLTNDVIKRLKDKRQTKSRAIELLKDLDKEVKAKPKRSVVNQIEANAVQDSISQSIAKKPGLRDMFLTTAAIGGAAAAPEFAIPIAAGKAAQIAIQQEPVARAALRAAQEGVKVPAILPRITAKAPAIGVTPIQRQESGSLQPQSLEEIKQERRIK